MTDDNVLSIREVAGQLKLAEKTVYSMAQKGEIPAFKIRGQWRIRKIDYHRWMADRAGAVKEASIRGLWEAAESARDAAARRASADEMHARSDALAERVKELKCLFSISKMLRSGQAELSDILQKIVDVLPSAWQHPGIAYAAITLKSRRYTTSGFREPLFSQQAEIKVEGERVGLLELGYSDLLHDGREPVFLHEEQTLLAEVADRVAEIVAFKEAQSQLATYQDHLRSLAAELTLAEERERRSLALSLHDRIGQGLAVAKLKIETLKHLLPAEHHQSLADISALIKQIVNDTRSLTFEISPPILYELGLKQAVAWLGEHMTNQFGLPVGVHCDRHLVELTEGMRVMLFRSIQELLTNTVKHARASRATVRLMSDQGDLVAVVEDNGIGFDPSSSCRHPSTASGFGLFSIRERIGHLGGRVEIDSSPGRGARIRLTVPGAANGGPE